MARQLTLDLALRPAFGREDFFVTQSNAAAVALVDQWPQWPSHAAIILGAEGSGKTHLASVWQQRSTAIVMPAHSLTIDAVPEDLRNAALVLENVEQVISNETALFHALNYAKQHNGYVLLTSRFMPSTWTISLPDLRSRVQALPIITIASPDDDLLRGVLVKHFADRQIAIGEEVINYILRRMPRSLAAVGQLVAELDAKALEQGVDITRPFVARTLEQYLAPDFLDD